MLTVSALHRKKRRPIIFIASFNGILRVEMTYRYKILFGIPEGRKRLRETGGCQSIILKRLLNRE
jgi:hypothetical protein